MLKRSACFFVAFILLLGICTGCVQKPVTSDKIKVESKTVSVSKEESQIIMKVGHSQPTTTPRHKSLLEFKVMVEERTNNAVKVEIYPSAQLGDESEMIEAVKTGTIQACRAGVFDAVAPELLIYTMPFLFNSLDSIQKVTMGSIGDEIAKHAQKNGIIILATGDAGGFRNFSNNIRPITRPEDLKGLKMRTPPMESIIKTMEVLGATPVSISYNETYMALKTNAADGQENPFVNIESMKFHEVQKYLTIVNYQFHPDPFNVNLEWYSSLSPEIRKTLKECALEMMKISDLMMEEGNDKAFEIIKNSMEIIVLTDEQRQVFIDRVQPVYDYFIKKGLFTARDIEEIRALTQ